jgi:hypothetical protein
MSGFMYLEQKGLMLKREAQYMNERLPQVVALLQNRCGGRKLTYVYSVDAYRLAQNQLCSRSLLRIITTHREQNVRVLFVAFRKE